MKIVKLLNNNNVDDVYSNDEKLERDILQQADINNTRLLDGVKKIVEHYKAADLTCLFADNDAGGCLEEICYDEIHDEDQAEEVYEFLQEALDNLEESDYLSADEEFIFEYQKLEDVCCCAYGGVKCFVAHRNKQVYIIEKLDDHALCIEMSKKEYEQFYAEEIEPLFYDDGNRTRSMMKLFEPDDCGHTKYKIHYCQIN